MDNTIYCYNDTSEPYPALYQNNTCVGTGDVFRVVQTRNSSFEGNKGPLLELCEVEVYGKYTHIHIHFHIDSIVPVHYSQFGEANTNEKKHDIHSV